MTMMTTSASKEPANKSVDMLEMVGIFNTAFGTKNYHDEPDAYGRKKAALLRLTLISEEFHEVSDELLGFVNGDGDLLNLAKELADLLYVVAGTAAVFNIPLNDVFEEVHQSNMSKLDADGKPVLRSDGKVIKGPNYKEPDLMKIFFDPGAAS